MPDPNLVPLFTAPTTREADEVERLLDAEGIAYEERLDAKEDGEESRVCFLATKFMVSESDLERSRRLLALNGFTD